jgi:hypothetical protein
MSDPGSPALSVSLALGIERECVKVLYLIGPCPHSQSLYQQIISTARAVVTSLVMEFVRDLTFPTRVFFLTTA